MVKKIKRNFYWFSFLDIFPISMSFAIYILFLKDNGMTFTQLGWINFVYMLGKVVFEIPTGAWADLFGRRSSVLVGLAIQAVGFCVYFFSHGFVGFVLAELILALGCSFVSGAADAWVKDTLDQNGHTGKLSLVFSKAEIVRQSAKIAGGMLGAWIFVYDKRIGMLLISILIILSIWPISRLLKEDYFEKKKANLKQALVQVKQIVSDSYHFGLKNHNVFWLLILALSVLFWSKSLNCTWSIQAEESLGLWAVSWLWAGICLTQIIGNLIISKYLQKGGQEKVALGVSLALTGVLVLLAASFSNGYVVFTFFLLHEAGRGAFGPANKAYLHDHVPSQQRATLGSFLSLFSGFGAGVGWLLNSYIIEFTSIPFVWAISGFGFLFTAWLVKQLRN